MVGEREGFGPPVRVAAQVRLDRPLLVCYYPSLTKGNLTMHEEFTAITEELMNKAKHLGLYVVGSTVATDNEDLVGDDSDMLDKNPDVKKMIDNGEAQFALMVQFTIGDLAFDTRVQNPTQHETDMEFRRLMPTEAELMRDKVQERLGSVSGDDDLLAAMFPDPIEVGDDEDTGST